MHTSTGKYHLITNRVGTIGDMAREMQAEIDILKMSLASAALDCDNLKAGVRILHSSIQSDVTAPVIDLVNTWIRQNRPISPVDAITNGSELLTYLPGILYRK